MKKCAHCKEWKREGEYSGWRRKYRIDLGGEGEAEYGRYRYLHSWCDECQRRRGRFKRGTYTSLDVLSELSIELDKGME